MVKVKATRQLDGSATTAANVNLPSSVLMSSMERAESHSWEKTLIIPERTGAVQLQKKWDKLPAEKCLISVITSERSQHFFSPIFNFVSFQTIY